MPQLLSADGARVPHRVAAGVAYRPLAIREALRGLRDFYLARLDERGDPEIRAALAEVERRLAIAPIGDT